VSERPFEVAHLSEIEAFASSGRGRRLAVRAHLGIRAFGVNAYEAAEAGKAVIDEHDEESSGHEELYLVVRGAATFHVGDTEIEGRQGTFVFVRDPATKRSAVAKEPGTTVLIIGGTRGEAFTVSGWELAAPGVQRLIEGEPERALELLMQVHTERPDDANILYNLACAESLAGRHDEALDHLTRAIALRESFLPHAQTDPDLDPIRGRPDFPRAAG
jgi:tetratricopeptide (TPR) repeat protein